MITSRNSYLNQSAIENGITSQAMDSKSARRIASDAIPEFTGEAIWKMLAS
jgi:hypothetical protein